MGGIKGLAIRSTSRTEMPPMSYIRRSARACSALQPPGVSHLPPKALADMDRHLKTISTLERVLKAILHGCQHWCIPNFSTHARAPVAGSLCPSDILLTSVYYEQFHQLSWFQMCLSRLSLGWAKAVRAYNQTLDPPLWSSHLITILWKLMNTMWSYHN
jgi:hypothetical protein